VINVEFRSRGGIGTEEGEGGWWMRAVGPREVFGGKEVGLKTPDLFGTGRGMTLRCEVN
jgi:hypothetical protein